MLGRTGLLDKPHATVNLQGHTGNQVTHFAAPALNDRDQYI